MAINYTNDAQKILDKYKIKTQTSSWQQNNKKQGQFSDDAEAVLEKYGVAGRQKTVEIPQVSAGSSVADLLPKPNEAERRNYAAMMQQKARFGAGNVDLYSRPQYKNADGSVSTVDSRSYNIDGKETLLPSVWMKNGKAYHSNDDNEIVQHYYDTGEYLGKFDTVAEANDYAEKLHQQQERYYAPKTETPRAEKKTENVSTYTVEEAEKRVKDAKSAYNQAKRDVNKQVRRGEDVDYAELNKAQENLDNAREFRDTLYAQDGVEDNRTFFRKVGDFFGNVGKSVASGAASSARGAVNEAGYVAQDLTRQNLENEAYSSEAIANLLSTVGINAFNGIENVERKNADEQRNNPLNTATTFGADLAAKTAYDTSNSNKVARAVYDVANGVGGMIPSIAANLLLPGSGLPVMFTYAAGNATEEALNSGASNDAALMYGAAVGGIEVLTEKMFGGIPGLGKGGLDAAVSKAIEKYATKETTQIAMTFLADALGEGFEEFVSEFADRWANKLFVGTDDRTLSETAIDAGYSFLIGALTSSVMSGGTNLKEMSKAQIRQKINGDIDKAYQSMQQNGLFSPNNAQAQKQARDTLNKAQQKETKQLRANAEETRKQTVALVNALNNPRLSYTDTVELGTPATQSEAPYMDMGRFRNTDAAAKNVGKNTVVPRGNNTNTAGTQSMNGNIVLPTANQDGRLPTYAEMQNHGKMEENKSSAKERQFAIIQNSNPMTDDQHTGIRSASEILTYDEATADYDGGNITPDYTSDMVQKAKETGEITVYSSKPIENGGFVTPSKMEAQNYAGDGKVYSATVKTSDIAWIDEIEGQYAKEVNNGREQSIGGERWQRSMAAAEQSESVAGFQAEEGNVREGESNGGSAVPTDYRSGVNLGIETAVDADEDTTKTLREVTDYNDDQRAIVEYGKKKGQTVRFYTGDLWVKDTPDGTPYRVRGLIHSDGKTIWVKADHGTYSEKQIYMHEDFHAAVMSSKKVLNDGIKRLKNKYKGDPAGLRSLIDSYVERYHIDDTNLSDEYVLEEILADAHAGIDVETKSRSGEKETVDLKKAADKAIKKGTRGTSSSTKNDTKFSRDGVNKFGIEVYTSDPSVLSMKWADRKQLFFDRMINEYRGRTAKFVRNGHAYYAKFTEGDVRKNIWGDNKSDDAGRDAKINAGASGDVFDLVENSKYNGSSKETGKTTAAHSGVSYWDYFVKTVQIDGKVFDLVANVRKKADGEYVYSLQLNENNMVKAAPPDNPTKNAGLQNGAQAASSKNITRPSRESQEKSSEPNPVAQDIVDKFVEKKQKTAATKNAAKASRDESPEWRQSLDKMVEEYGEMPAGEKPHREISMPNKTSESRKLSMTVRTILEAKATPDTMVDTIEQLAEKGDFSYETYGDKRAIKDAEARITDAGWDKSLETWKKSVQSGKVTKKNTTLGWALYNNAANSGNTDVAIDILNNMVEHQRNAAQALQATRILKQMNPETQLYGAARSIRNLQEELNERYGEDNAPKLEIDQGLAEHFMKAKDDSERAEALKDIYRDIGRQMPSRFIDKVNAWRYLAMLGNARTHVRNVIGNAGFAPVVAAKDLTATAIESIVSRTANIERTKAIVSGKGGKELISAAWNDYANISEDAMGGGKYTDLVNANKYIEEGKRVFGTSKADWWNKTGGKALETVRQKNGEFLDKEDQWFSQPHYAYAMAQYCKANGITAEQIAAGGNAVEKARAYAIKEAQKATYRDTNDFSQFISNLGRSRMMSKNKLTKGVSMLVEGILPFRKTPANILARGMEYSPLGLIKSLSYDLNQVKNGKMEASEAIDNISAGLTGTGLLALGVFLSSLGLVRGKGDDDEKENEFEDLLGHQNYALELPNGKSVTLDWLAPEALPFFVGTNLWEQTGKIGEGVTLDTVLTAITNVSEPLLEMSCLQSLNDLFESYGYSKGKNGLTRTIVSGATSYLTQFVPTILGQVERSAQESRMTTYTNKTGFLNNTDLQYLIGGVSAKIPVWDYRQIEYIDAWGRTESSGGFVKRALNNFLNPAYTSEITVSDMENELMRLYDATGENVFPSRADKYFNVGTERKDLTKEEYVEYAKQKGETSYAVATKLTESSAYKKMPDADKAKAIKEAYNYANQIAKKNVGGYTPESWVTEAKEAYEKYKIPIATYILIKTDLSGIESYKDEKGKSISNSSGLQKMQRIYKNYPNLSASQMEYLFDCFDIGKTVRGYSKEQVDSELRRLKTK